MRFSFLLLLSSLINKLFLLLLYCSAGVGRTGTYIGIDAMMESAEKKKTVFIQNYVQVMRRARPHMVQKDVSKHVLTFISYKNDNNVKPYFY